MYIYIMYYVANDQVQEIIEYLAASNSLHSEFSGNLNVVNFRNMYKISKGS